MVDDLISAGQILLDQASDDLTGIGLTSAGQIFPGRESHDPKAVARKLPGPIFQDRASADPMAVAQIWAICRAADRVYPISAIALPRVLLGIR